MPHTAAHIGAAALGQNGLGTGTLVRDFIPGAFKTDQHQAEPHRPVFRHLGAAMHHAVKKGFIGVGQAHHGCLHLMLQQQARGLYARIEVIEEISAVFLLFRNLMNMYAGIRDNAENALGARRHITELRSRRGLGELFRVPDTLRRDNPRGNEPVLGLAVFIGLMARTAGRDPPSQCGILEGLRVMAERYALGLQQAFQFRPIDTRLNSGGHGMLVNLEYPVHQGHVHRHHSLLAFTQQGSDTADDAGSAAIGDKRHRVPVRIPDHGLDFFNNLRVYNGVRRVFETAAAQMKHIMITAAPRVISAFEAIRFNATGQYLFQCLELFRDQAHRRHYDVLQSAGRGMGQHAQPGVGAQPFPNAFRLVTQCIRGITKPPSVPT
ncbi:MAG: hypothetical protein BWY09_01539 [Candidatus Hydrogenedentes bacterium ADurb.Bin179]|nr:MAG: hypothetical protein BWY09_01539 [Candidatus Hydrogenedentes bacterium ADurb.Bin179]